MAPVRPPNALAPPAASTGPARGRSPHALAGVVPGAVVLALLLLALRVAGLGWLPAYALAAATGAAVTAAWGRRAAGAAAATGLAVTLTLAYSMLVGVLDAFVLAVAGVG